MAARCSLVATFLYLTAVVVVSNALSSHPYYKDYLRKRATERVERVNNLLATLSKLSADDDSVGGVDSLIFPQENPTNVKDCNRRVNRFLSLYRWSVLV